MLDFSARASPSLRNPTSFCYKSLLFCELLQVAIAICEEKIVIVFVNYNKKNDFVRKISHIDGFRSLILNTYNNNSISNLIRALNNVFAFYKVHYTGFAMLDYSIKQIRESLNCNIKNELK